MRCVLSFHFSGCPVPDNSMESAVLCQAKRTGKTKDMKTWEGKMGIYRRNEHGLSSALHILGSSEAYRRVWLFRIPEQGRTDGGICTREAGGYTDMQGMVNGNRYETPAERRKRRTICAYE